MRLAPHQGRLSAGTADHTVSARVFRLLELTHHHEKNRHPRSLLPPDHPRPSRRARSRQRSLAGHFGRRPDRTDHERRPTNPAGLPRALGPGHAPRSEEHTSELQSLMRTTYAVVCVKKKKRKRKAKS